MDRAAAAHRFRLKKGMDAVCEAHTPSAKRNLSVRSELTRHP
ncbi:hypothetical protein GAGA_0878 [Paraglaciecola agarilytica NO2]|uniref:Uncharacterized protein n=1 Tax=Paraglaciecola agarilytica NO2 TaxID=1125747 RepID=A0ABQ0I361_9ALTE|nr:hypothetical protein GAGA_0878 [Paraglaciecola agarilytica NO2]